MHALSAPLLPAGRLRIFPRRYLGILAAAVAVALLATALFFREDLARWKLLSDASRAAENGQLALAEEKLEQLLEGYPDSEKASELVLEVSSELVLLELPLELTAEHPHRFGSCTGRLTLRDDGLEYSSKSHGRWQWRFEQVQSLDAESSWDLSVQTYEDDMLGLLAHKNYNFSLLGPSPGEEFWKRYQRHFQHLRQGNGGT